MKLSEVTDFNCLSIEEYTKIVYGDYIPNIEGVDAIILLGGAKLWCLDRASVCSKIAKELKVKYILPTGGVICENNLTEAEYLRELLIKDGIDKDKIILENKATTTKENMTYTNEILKNLNDVKKVLIVTSHFHLRRSLELAKSYLDKKYKIEGYPGQVVEGNKENWYKSDYYTKRVHQEAIFLKSHIEKGYIPDIEF